MHRRTVRSASLFTILAALALVTLALAAQADEDEGDDRHHRHHNLLIEGDHAGMIGRHHGALFEILEGKGGFLGVHLTELTPELRTHFGAPEDVGVMVSRVVSDSPAEKAGLRVGDVITRVDGEDVHSSGRLKHLIAERGDGEAAVIEIWRDGGLETVTANLEEREGHGLLPRRILLDCEEGDDCGLDLGRMRLHLRGGGLGLHMGCGDTEDCEMKIRCEDGDCDCTVNGEESDCEGLHLNKLHNKHLD